MKKVAGVCMPVSQVFFVLQMIKTILKRIFAGSFMTTKMMDPRQYQIKKANTLKAFINP
jgi:hypothetical protein